MAIFELDPRGRPPFDLVFYHQRHLRGSIAMALFFRSLYLLKALSSLNSVKSKFAGAHHNFNVLNLATMNVMKKLVIKLVGWTMFMIPLTFAFCLVGMRLLNASSASFRSVRSCFILLTGLKIIQRIQNGLFILYNLLYLLFYYYIILVLIYSNVCPIHL